MKRYIKSETEVDYLKESLDDIDTILEDLESMGFDSSDRQDVMEGLGACLGYDRSEQREIIKELESRGLLS